MELSLHVQRLHVHTLFVLYKEGRMTKITPMKWLLVLAVVVIVAGVTPAMADTDYTVSFSSASAIPAYYGTVTLDTTNTGLVTNAWGTIDGQTVTGVVPLGTDGSFDYDNVFNTVPPVVDNNGILFALANSSVLNLYSSNGSGLPWNPGSANDYLVDPNTGNATQVNLRVPEPGILALLGLGSGLFGLIRFRPLHILGR